MGSTVNKNQNILHKSKSEDVIQNLDSNNLLVRRFTFNKTQKQLGIDAITKMSIQESIKGDSFDDSPLMDLMPKTQNEFPKEILTYDLNGDIQFEARALNSKIKASMTNSTTIPAMISLKAKDLLVKQEQRTGLDLVCIIDRSASMSGKKIKMVKDTLLTLLNFLSEKDRFSIILFDHNTQILFKLKKVTQQKKQFFRDQIGQIDVGGRTNILKGLIQGLQLLKNRQSINQVTSIFLLSDGQDSSSEKKLNEIFSNINFPFTLHTFGYGNDHDAKVMTQISKIGNGNFYFIQNLSLLDEFFIDALGSLITVVGQQVKIDVSCNPQPPFDKIIISKTFGSMWEQKVSKKEYQINFPVIASGQNKDFVFELEIPKLLNNIKNKEQIVTIVNFNLQLQCPKTKRIIEKTCQLNLILCDDEQQLLNMENDLDVLAQYYRVKGTDIIQQARLACENEKFEEGKKLIQNIILEIESDEKIKNLSSKILEDLEQALEGCDVQQYRNYGQTMMMQQVSNNYQQSGLSAQFNQHGHQFSSPMYYQNSFTRNLISAVQNSKSTKCSSNHYYG